MKNTDKRCILCGSKEAVFYHEDAFREYFRCKICGLVFVPPEYWLSAREEKKRYDLHENDPGDEGYSRFLRRLFVPINERLAPGSKGLDFGSGPGPALHGMFEDADHPMRHYDLYYQNDKTVFEEQYDFITATEVVEHLHRPAKELGRLWRCLKENGWLGIMTKLVEGREAFQSWHYIRDRTHVAFFSKQTFDWLAGKWQAGILYIEPDIILLQKTKAAL